MICTAPLQTLPISSCIGELTIGKVAPSTNVVVHLLDITTKREEQFQVTSNLSGEVIIDLSDYEFTDRHAYQAWITPADSSVKATITIGTTTAKKVTLNFVPCVENGEPVVLADVTLEVA